MTVTGTMEIWEGNEHLDVIHISIISELQAINTTWGEAKRKAQDRTRWKETVVALCPPWDVVE